MTTAPVSLSHHPGYYDENARTYLQALQTGQKPQDRPDFGRWSAVVEYVEKAYDQVTTNKGPIIQKLLDQMCQIPKYQELKELLAGPALHLVKESVQDIPVLPKYAQLPPALAQNACPELDWYEAFSRKASDRAHDQFHQFCGLWLFSVIAGRRASLKIKQKRFYTNLMLAQCGATSFYAKSFTANVAKSVLYELGLGYALAPNRITPQKLLSDMAGGHVPANFDDLEEEKQERTRRRLGMPGQKGLLFDELGLFIQSMLRKNSVSADFADLLMTFDECPPEYENSTIARGGEAIEKPYLSLLGNMTPANLKQNAKAGADFWQDGFWARFSFVVAPPPPTDQEDQGPPQVSELDDLDLPIPPALLNSLKEWHERLGIPVCHLEPKLDKKGEPTGNYSVSRGELPAVECQITTEARQAWVNYEHALRQLCLKLPHQDFNGSYVRLAETAMRLAVLMASLSNQNLIDLRIWAKAQELAEVLRANLHELYSQVNGDILQTPTYARTLEDKILELTEKFVESGKDAPNLRTYSQYIKGVDIGRLRTALLDLKSAHLLDEVRSNRTVRYVPGRFEDG